MKTIKTFMLVAFAATISIACQKELANDNDILATGDVVTFTGRIDKTETKTFIQYEAGLEAGEFNTLFTSSDKFTVNGNASLSSEPSDDRKFVTFSVDGVEAPYFVMTSAQIQKNSNGEPVNFNQESKTYSIQIAGTGAPQMYTTVTGGAYTSFQSNADILAAYSTDEHLRFQHMSTFYAITVDKNKSESEVQKNIRKIYVRQGDGDNIAGNWYLKFEETEGDFVPVLKPSTLTAAIALDCGEGGLEQGTTMILGLPAYNYASGLIFTLEDVDGNFDSYLVKPDKTQHALDGGKLIPFNPPFNPVSGTIATVEQWNAFAEIMNNKEKTEEALSRFVVDGQVKVCADLKGDITSIDNLPADIIINGNGKTITRNNATQALFSNVSGTVKDLTLAGNFKATASQGDAPFVGTLADGGTISGCTNMMTITFDKSDHAYVAGIVKKMIGGTIENCVNNGEIKVKLSGNKNVGIGGIVGQADASGQPMIIKNCVNKQKITFAPVISTDNDGSPVCGVGGVVGWLRRAESFTLENCDNEGEVTYSAENITSTLGAYKDYPICVGGIIGVGSTYNGSVIDDVNNGIKISISNCDNSGTVYNCGVVNTTNKASGKRAFTGGLAGFLLGKSGDGNYASISYCTNTGAVYTYNLTGEGSSTMPYFSSVASGFVGFGGYLNMDNCTINCLIGCKERALMSLGGVIGMTVRPFTLTNSNVHIEGYYNRISNYQNNRAVVASVPTYYGGNTNNPMTITPDITDSAISNCKIGGHIYTTASALTTANGAKTTDLSGSDYSVTLFNSTDKATEGAVVGQGYTTVETDVTIEGITYWNGK